MVFQWIMSLLAVIMNFGGVIDARAHIQHGFELESFFTLTHGLLYAGWILGGAALAIHIYLQRRKGAERTEWLPKGYFISLIGFLVFGFGGGYDFFWHGIYGFEANLEAPISPGHTLLVIGAGLMYSAVIFHGYHLKKQNPDTFGTRLNRLNLPAILASISLLTAMLWPTWFMDPMLVDFPSGGEIASRIVSYRIFSYGTDLSIEAGLAGIFLMTLLTVPFIVLMLHRFRMPSGFLLIMVTGYTALRAMVGNAYVYLPAALVAALACELVWVWVRRGGEQRLSSPTGYRIIAFLLPFVQYWVYFVIIDRVVSSNLWSPYLWTGGTFLAGVFGFLMSYILVKPANQGIDKFLYRFNILEA